MYEDTIASKNALLDEIVKRENNKADEKARQARLSKGSGKPGAFEYAQGGRRYKKGGFLCEPSVHDLDKD